MFKTLEKYMTESERELLITAPVESVKTKKTGRRNFNAAQSNRLTSAWITSPISINQSLRGNLRKLRERSRDAARNDPYAKKYFSLVRSNVIGAGGINFQVKTENEDHLKKIATDIEAQFKIWSRKEYCTLTGKLSWIESQRLFVTKLARDGEVLIRKVYDKTNPFGFSLKFYDASWLDENMYSSAPNGNQIIMGVEIDANDKPVAYWLTPPMGDWMIRNRKITRVPADEIIHAFMILEDETQARGVPWLHASLLKLNMLDGYEEAELVGRRISASNMGFFSPPFDAENQDDEDDDGNKIDLIEEFEPGVLKELPPGYTFSEFNPKNPDSTADSFKSTVLGGVAAGADVAKHSITGDMSEVNYSSARIAMLDERDFWQTIQQFVIENFCQPIFDEWLKSAMLMNQLNLTAKDYEKVRFVKWFPRGWSWVDPEKEVKADVLAIEEGLTTATEVLAEQGQDIEEFLKIRQKEQQLYEQYGVEYPKNDKSQPVPNNPGSA